MLSVGGNKVINVAQESGQDQEFYLFLEFLWLEDSIGTFLETFEPCKLLYMAYLF